MGSRRPGQAGTPRGVFGAMVRHYRAQAGLTQAELAARVYVSADMISKIEQGQKAAAAELTARLDAVPELDTRGGLTRLRQELGDGLYSAGYPEWFADWASSEGEATTLRLFQPLVVPGLLQTEDYARAIFSTRVGITGDEIDDLVAARMKRQEVLTGGSPPMLWALVDEWVLRRPVGGRHVMLEQVNRLIEAARQPSIVIEVIPATAGAHLGLTGAFAIADFEDVPSTGYLETAIRGQPVESRNEVAALDLTWATLRGEALPRKASQALVEEAAKSWTSAT